MRRKIVFAPRSARLFGTTLVRHWDVAFVATRPSDSPLEVVKIRLNVLREPSSNAGNWMSLMAPDMTTHRHFFNSFNNGVHRFGRPDGYQQPREATAIHFVAVQFQDFVNGVILSQKPSL
jgi:hypothetical protein